MNLHWVEKGYVGITNFIGEKEMATPETFSEYENAISIELIITPAGYTNRKPVMTQNDL